MSSIKKKNWNEKLELKKKKIISHEISNKIKFSHKNLILSDVVGETNSCISKISILKKKSAFEISVCAAKKV